MPRTPSWTVLLVGLALSCGSREPEVPEPPEPPNLADFDPRAVGRIEEALAKVRSDPRRSESWVDLGLVYASERLKSLALECFGVAEELAPRQPKWPYRQAVTLAQMGEFERAIEAMQRSLALEPGYPPSHARLGSYRLSLGDLDGAERDFRAATELDSSYPGGWVGLARVALQRDRSDEALAILERLSKEDPEDRTFQQLLAVARQQAGGEGALSAEGLLADEEIPVWNDPWELEVRAFRAKPTMLQVDKLLESGQTEEALALLQDERAHGADDCATTLKIARVLQRMGRAEESMREIEAALALEPENTTALVMKAQAIDDRGEYRAAIALLDRVTELQPHYGGAFAAKGTKLFMHGDFEHAVEALQRARELGVNDPELRDRLGRGLIALKRWPEARAVFEELVAERPGDGDAWLELAMVQCRLGKLTEAEASIARGKATGTASADLLGDIERAYEVASERRAKRTKQDDSR